MSSHFSFHPKLRSASPICSIALAIPSLSVQVLHDSVRSLFPRNHILTLDFSPPPPSMLLVRLLAHSSAPSARLAQVFRVIKTYPQTLTPVVPSRCSGCPCRLCVRWSYFLKQLREFLLAVFLVQPLVYLGDLRRVHRTELRPTHRAELRFLVKIIRQCLIMHGPGGFGVQRKLELFVPVEKKTRVAERVVAVARAGTVTRDVCGVRCDFVGNYTLANVVRIRQSQMFFRRDVTKHGSSVPANQGRSNGAGDVVVSRRNVGDQRAQRVKRSSVAQLVFLFYLQLDLIQRNVPGAFDHYLHVVFPGFFREFAENAQFGKLRFVAGVGHTAGTQTVAQGIAHVVLLEDFADSFEILVQEILLFVKTHPLRQQRAAPADDSGDAIADKRQELAQYTGMNRHVI